MGRKIPRFMSTQRALQGLGLSEGLIAPRRGPQGSLVASPSPNRRLQVTRGRDASLENLSAPDADIRRCQHMRKIVEVVLLGYMFEEGGLGRETSPT